MFKCKSKKLNSYDVYNKNGYNNYSPRFIDNKTANFKQHYKSTNFNKRNYGDKKKMHGNFKYNNNDKPRYYVQKIDDNNDVFCGNDKVMHSLENEIARNTVNNSKPNKKDRNCRNFGKIEKLNVNKSQEVSNTKSKHNNINKLLTDYKHIFAKSKCDVGLINMDSPKIQLTSELPISQRPYRTSPADDKEIKKQLDQLLDAKIIVPSCSQYSSPITLAFKKEDNAKTRLCIDYRKLNQITKTDSEPLPRIDQILDSLKLAKIYSTIDLCSGYWHVKLNEKEAEKLAFTSNYGLYQFTRLPFGFKNAPAIFQRAIRQILNKYQINFALNYFDDIIIFSNSEEEHYQHLKTIFDICEKENIKLKQSKCNFARDTIDFLGYEVKQGSYSPNNTNIETIKKLLPPRNVKDLQRFLGSINVYHKFIQNYAQIRIPLNNLLKKDKKWEWTPECQQAFITLKNSLISKPILALYNPNYPCHIYVDASKESVAAILKQEKPDGTQHPIAYHSRRLRPYEINYTITELECLAIIDSLDKFHYYLHGTHFTIHTDHHSLVWLKSFKNPTGRLFRWSLKISMYDFTIKYKKGSTNVEADMLTRNPIAMHMTITNQEPLLDINDIIKFQNLENITAPRSFIKNNIITVQRKNLTKIVVPKALRITLLEKVHKQFGHPGVASMLKIISPQYYWEKIIEDVGKFVKHCEICQMNKKSNQKKFGFMQSLPLCEKPFELLSIDSVGGLNYYNSTKKYLHIVVDHATRYIWTFPSKNATTETYINCLKSIFQNQTPEKLLSDRNAAFTSSKFKHFLRHNNVTQLLTSAHRPQTNGKVERVNQTIITRLKCKISSSSSKVPWTKILENVTQEYNSTPHSITGFPPMYLMYGKLPYEISFQENQIYPPIEEARNLAKKRTEQYFKINKTRYDKKFQETKFKEGDLVIYEEFAYPNTRKLTPPYSGPYTILRKCSDVLYEINRPNALYKKDTEIVHSTRLRNFHPSNQLQLNYINKPTVETSKETDVMMSPNSKTPSTINLQFLFQDT